MTTARRRPARPRRSMVDMLTMADDQRAFEEGADPEVVLDTPDDFQDWTRWTDTHLVFAISADHHAWILYSNQDGDWYALRPLTEDDLLDTAAATRRGSGVLTDPANVTYPLNIISNAWL